MLQFVLDILWLFGIATICFRYTLIIWIYGTSLLGLVWVFRFNMNVGFWAWTLMWERERESEREREHDYMRRMGFVRYTYIYLCGSVCSEILYSIPTTSLNQWQNERSSLVTYFSSIDQLVFWCSTSIFVRSFSANQLLNTTTHNAPFFFHTKKKKKKKKNCLKTNSVLLLYFQLIKPF